VTDFLVGEEAKTTCVVIVIVIVIVIHDYLLEVCGETTLDASTV
jgi:hypothetical protein